MDFVRIDFPTKIEERELSQLVNILNAIRSETLPKEDHNDPGALNDCWETVIETAEQIRNIDNSSIGDVLREYMEQSDKHGYTIEHDVKNNANGELLQAAISVLSNNINLLPSAWKGSQSMETVFAKELYGRLAVACAFILKHMDITRIVNARKSGATVFVNSVNSDTFMQTIYDPAVGTTRFCKHCKEDTKHKVKLYNPDDATQGEVWECGICNNAVDFV